MTRQECNGSPPYPAVLAWLASAVLGLSACGADREKETVPGTPPVAPQGQTVKPTITAAKLIPKAATAPRSWPGSDAAFVMDGDSNTGWNAGNSAPQWIQLDLGEPTVISDVLLCPNQSPDGWTTHKIYGGPSLGNLKLLGTLEGNTRDRQWLELKVAASDVRYLKVDTIKSPSWVAWREIEIYK